MKTDTQDIIIENKNEYEHRKKLFAQALKILNPREKEIIELTSFKRKT